MNYKNSKKDNDIFYPSKGDGVLLGTSTTLMFVLISIVISNINKLLSELTTGVGNETQTFIIYLKQF